MPIYLPPLSRRAFLRGSLGCAAASFLPRLAWAKSSDPHTFALLADTHVHADAAKSHGGVVMSKNFEQVVQTLLTLPRRPNAALVLGDCAFGDGRLGDYGQFGRILAPLRSAGWPLHLALGNHDDREVFLNSALVSDDTPPPVAKKLVSLIRGERANWFVLDSLMKVNVVTGELGDAQIDWLGRVLDEHADRPALIGVHHPPQFDLRPGETVGGIKDTAALFDCLRPRRHVKAVIFGHTHRWSVTQRDGIHLVNLPPTAYVFEKGRPQGWVNLTLATDGATVTLHTLDAAHSAAGETHTLTWRSA